MKLQVAPYNNTAGTWTEAEETAFLHYAPTHGFDSPAEVTITLSDPTGVLARKYNADADDVYVGPGKVTIEDPTGTDIFYGRIMKAEANTANRTVTLYCQDWLSQLDEEQITYDMREPLNDAGLRQSIISSDVDGTCKPVSQTFLDYATAGDAAVYTDETAKADDGTADDMTLLPAVPAVGDAYYFGMDSIYDRIMLNISTAGVGTWTITWEYYGVLVDGNACGVADWYALSGVSDDTSGFTVAGENSVSWTTLAAGFHISCDPIGEGASYWIRGRVSAYTSVTTQPLGKQAWIQQILYDDDIEDFTADEWNGKYLIFPSAAAGTQTLITGPYAHTVTVGGTTAGTYADVWLDDANFHDMTNGAGNVIVDYAYHVNVPHGSLYSSGPSAGKVYIVCKAKSDQAANSFFKVFIKDAAETYYEIHESLSVNSSSIHKRIHTFTIPEKYLTDEALIETTGEIELAVGCYVVGANATFLDVYQCLLELTYTVEGTTTAYPIIDNTTNTITSTANHTYKGLASWERKPYCIAKEIYLHIESATGPVLGGDTMVTLTCADGNVEDTSGISTRQYVGKTRLEILKDLAVQDKAHFWVTLGGSTVTWKSTFNDGAPETLTDTDWNAVSSTFDYSTLTNETTVYGMRIGDERLSSTYTDATSEAKYKQTRTKVTSDTGLVSEYDTLARATAIVNQYKDVQQILTATIRGNTATAAHDKTLVLGDEVSITSTYLGLSAAVYIVQRWSYDSRNNLTTLLLHPRVSAIGLQRDERSSFEQVMQAGRRGSADTYIAAPESNEVA